jgi:hypothetical protein
MGLGLSSVGFAIRRYSKPQKPESVAHNQQFLIKSVVYNQHIFIKSVVFNQQFCIFAGKI